ncbi:hypothetical protein BN874_1620024 [Candidatus Contendobacter odensis Run_B_J11]|uniref:Uncharacterized protein n=1 Tax=Candidatus Contendobacter odensis Run_B_J11 TaxID=1400861 RepID=A0A7U7G9J1_9GAMM|nr:hypothetical protein BN874_1620024 [Candidatus Contendobacter odensis Run_B_J11]
MKPELMIEHIKDEAAKFAEIETSYDEPTLYGITDGKAVGTYLEHKFIPPVNFPVIGTVGQTDKINITY